MRYRLLLILAAAAAVAVALFIWSRDGDPSSAPAGKHAEVSPSQETAPAVKAKTRTEALASLRGTVLAADGTPLQGATVVLVADDETAPLRAHDAAVQTSEDGGFSYSALPKGRYTISANAPGFVPTSKKLALSAGQARNEFTLQLSPGGVAISGVVRDATGGVVPGAIVQAMPANAGTSTPSGTLAGADGAYALSLTPGAYTVWAFLEGYVPDSKLLSVGAGPIQVDFQLAPGGAVEGQVKHLGTNRIVPGAIVTYATEKIRPFGLWQGTSGRGQTRADDDGRFRITGLGSGIVLLSAHGDHATTSEPMSIPLGIAEERSGVELYVDAAHSVRGRVVDAESGEGIEGMNVSLSASEEFGLPGSVKTDTTGAFVITGVARGDYRIQVRGKEYLPDLFGTSVSVEGDTNAGDIALSRGAMVRGRVEPAMEAEVMLDLSSLEELTPTALATAQADSTGAFELGPLTPGSFRLLAEAEGGLRGTTPIVLPLAGVSDVVISLEPSSSLAGTVVDKAGKPVSDARVALRARSKKTSVTVVVNGLERTAKSARTSPDGSFRIEGLAAGAYEIRVHDRVGNPLAWANPTSVAPKPIEIGAKEERRGERLTVEAQDEVITGTVLLPDGGPAADTWVSARLANNVAMSGPIPDMAPPEGEDEDQVETRSEVRMVMMQEDGDGSGPPGAPLTRSGELPPVLTDADGTFTIRGLRSSTYNLIAEGLRGAARASLRDVKAGSDVNMQLAHLTRIEGTVTQDGAPVPKFTVSISGAAHARKQVYSDEGRFTLHRFSPGPYTVHVRGENGEAEVDIEVVPGTTTNVAIALESLVRVTGTIVDESGAPIAGLLTLPTPKREDGNVQIDISESAQESDAQGRFEVFVKPGSYLLIALRMGAGPVVTVPFDATAGADVDLGTVTAQPQPPMEP